MKKTIQARPVHKEKFDRWRKKITDQHPIHHIDPLFNMACEQAVVAYHGGKCRAGWSLFWNGAREMIRSFYWNAIYGLCDRVGWTKIVPLPGLPLPMGQRHGGKCDKLNCDDIHCVQNGIPLWFRKLTRMNHWE